MAASGDFINYSLRPAKAVERKMLKDAFSMLYPFDRASQYKYIGFGSKYFSDFKIFHKSLNIDDMISIESDVQYQNKYEFNKPFNCIKMEFGDSTNVLSRITFDKKFIAWMDYDSVIDNSMLIDVGILIENIISGSIVLVSYNSFPQKKSSLENDFNDRESSHDILLKRWLEERVQQEFIPPIPRQGLSKANNYSKIIREIFNLKISHSFVEINAALPHEQKWNFSQICYFNYKDGVDMSTIGWIFYRNCDADKFQACNFDSLEFFSDNENAVNITVPNLTLKEATLLSEAMPASANTAINMNQYPFTIFSASEVAEFSKIYKYFPNFSDIETA